MVGLRQSRSGPGPIRVHHCNWADQGHAVGTPTVDDTIDESRLEHTRAILPLDKLGSTNSDHMMFSLSNTEE